MEKGFLVVGLNPTLQNTYSFDTLELSQVNRVRRHRIDLAGKGGNTSRVLVQLEERALHLTYCGGINGVLYRQLSADEAIELRAPDRECDVRFCHTLLDLAAGTATEIVEPGAEVTAELEADILAEFRAALPEAHTLIVGGSKAPGFSPDLYSTMVREAHAAGLESILDIRGDDLLKCMEHRPTAIKINVSEFVQTFLPGERIAENTVPEELPDRLFETMHAVHERYGASIVLTNGSHPVVYVDGERIGSIAPAPSKPVNAIGSGDAFTAGYVVGYRRHGTVRAGVELGMECARRNVEIEKPGSIR